MKALEVGEWIHLRPPYMVTYAIVVSARPMEVHKYRVGSRRSQKTIYTQDTVIEFLGLFDRIETTTFMAQGGSFLRKKPHKTYYKKFLMAKMKQ